MTRPCRLRTSTTATHVTITALGAVTLGDLRVHVTPVSPYCASATSPHPNLTIHVTTTMLRARVAASSATIRWLWRSIMRSVTKLNVPFVMGRNSTLNKA